MLIKLKTFPLPRFEFQFNSDCKFNYKTYVLNMIHSLSALQRQTEGPRKGDERLVGACQGKGREAKVEIYVFHIIKIEINRILTTKLMDIF